MSDHGAHFDVFSYRAAQQHGGGEFDTGFGLQAQADPHGEHFDRFVTGSNVDAHGARWDEFGWQEMPVRHGRNFDEEFSAPTANEGRHGTWFDVFEGGKTQIRYVSNNAEVEAVVIDLDADHAKVERRDGGRDEVELSQILMWREGVATDFNTHAQPDRPKAGTPEDQARGGQIASLNTDSIPPSDAEAPSAHDAVARGGTAQSTIDPQMETPVITLKAVDEVYDVGKLNMSSQSVARAAETHRSNLAHISNGDYGKVACPSCGEKGSYDVGHQPMKGPKAGQSKMFGSCRDCGFKHTFPPPKIKRQAAPSRLSLGKTAGDELDVEKVDERDAAAAAAHPVGKSVSTTVHSIGGRSETVSGKVIGHKRGQVHVETPSHGRLMVPLHQIHTPVGKSVDSSETAIQGETESGAQASGANWCPHCQHTCRKVEDGKCPTCGGPVKVKKIAGADVLADVLKTAGLA